jgi:hypothetical protein
MRKALTTLVLGWFARLRFPTLLTITAILFVVNVIVPDFLPFIDEILLGLVTLILANWKKRDEGGSGTAGDRRPPIDVTPTRGGRAPDTPDDSGTR